MDNIADIYELSPMQQGMLFHTLYAPKSGVYFEQLSFTLHAELHISAFKYAWEEVVERHPVLRTSFYWEDVDKPVQVVHKQVELPWEQPKWPALAPTEQEERLEAFLQADREQGFELDQAPLMRCVLIKVHENTYQFVWSFHHLLIDGWSVPLILKEVFAFYEYRKDSKNLHLNPPRPYRDYIVWLQQQDLSQSEAFWRQALQGFSVPTPLVVDRAVDSLSNPKDIYDEQHIQLSASVTAALLSLARRHHLTLNTVVQGAWAVLLSRYSGEEDVVFGSTVSGRPTALAGAESMVGLFINTLPVRVQVSGEASLLPWLQQLQTDQVEREQYSYSPLVEIQGWSDVPRGLPLFESLVVFENYPVDASLQDPSGSFEISNVRFVERTNYPLTVEAAPGSELSLGMSYDSCRFDAATISRMLGHFQTILEAIVANPQQHLKELPLLTAAERHQLLVEWNDTQIDYAQDRCIHQLFEAQVQRTPDAVAVVFADEQLTYRELNYRANQLAHHLQALGVKPDSLVGICMERSLEMVVGLMGILKAGGAYVPLDPDYPSERLAYMLNDSEMPVLVTTQKLSTGLPEHQARVVCLNQDWGINSPNSDVAPVSSVTDENLAYVIYTSGSTGKPKGVAIAHRSLVNAYFAWEDAYQLRSLCTSHLQMASFSFDVFSGDVVRALCSGAKLVICPREWLVEPENLYELMRKERVDCADFVPAVLRNLIQYLERTKQDLSFMRLLIVGSDSWYVKDYQQFQRFCGAQTRLINAYGASEATIDSSYFESTALSLSIDRLVPIGRPFANTQIYILDSHLQPVPIGVAGELHIGGAGLARSYLHQLELTEQKFIPNPFRNNSGDRLYKTGDLGRYLPNGTIEFLGRVDNQVKIRGFRVEPGEIEAVLSQHPAVQEIVVVVREDVPGNKRLVAYLVVNQATAGVIPELQYFVKQKLPKYMVPSAFVLLEALPLTPNGKIDRRTLPAPETSRSGLEEGFVAPRTSTEEVLAAIWAEVLGLEQVGIHDNFFELGGDSILSILIIARANQAGLSLTPRQLFQHQTIAELVDVAGTTILVQAEQGLVTGEVPLTPIQQWFFEQNLPAPHHFNQSVLVEVAPELKPELLKQVVQELLVHHDALRLRFVRDESIWQQVNVGLEETVPFTVVDFSQLSSGEQQTALEAAAAELQTNLNLREGPAMRVALFNFGIDKPARLLLIIHHLAVDGVSWRILLEDLSTAYQQLSRGEAIQLQPKTTSFKDWAYRLMEYGQSEALSAELDYWLAESWSRVAPLPVDYPSSKEPDTVASAAHVSVSLSVEQTRSLLQEIPHTYNTQINDVLLTALVQVFGWWTGERSLLFDLEGHGREELFEGVDLSRTVGWFTTVFPILLELRDVSHPPEALKSVKEQLRRTPNRGIGYGLLRYLSRDAATRLKLQGLPQAEVSFNYLGQLDQVLSKPPLLGLAKESSEPDHSPLGSRSHLLEVNGFVAEGKLQLDWTYSKNVHQRGTVEGLAKRFMEALQSLIAHCQYSDVGGYTPSDFPEAELSQEELDELVAELNVSEK